MTQPAKCPECGAPLPANSPEGLCRACLLRRGLESNTVGYTHEPRTPWLPPTVEELAAHFPELEIQRLIGRGGMGAVYQARQKSLDRTVALKILPPAMASEAAFAERFAREAQAMAKLNHPHIVTIYEFGHLGSRTSSSASAAATPDLYFFLMEYVDGVNLRGLLDTGHISPKEALAIVPQICEALQYAHDQGIVHRDIKPENILLNKQGRVKIADFGLAKLMGIAGESRTQKTESRNEEAVTVAGSMVGTPQYMAPEQKEHPTEVDHRADIYSLGVVFYQMLTGELPKGAFEPPSRKVHIDVRLDEIVLKALEREPEHRYQHASEVKTQVETIAATPTDSATLPYARNPSPQEAPRLSRNAVVAACWSTFVVFAALFWAEISTGNRPGQVLTPLGYALAYSLAPLGITAPFGTTLLGWIAVSQIRRSGGRLYGLPLALFDGLVFPLLVLTGLAAWFWWWVFGDLLYPHQIDGLSLGSPPVQVSRLEDLVFNHGTALIVLATLVTAAILLVLIIRAVWRAVSKPMTGAKPPHETISPAAAPEGVTVSAWCRVVSLLLGTTFTSRLAIRLTNLSALGFLGFLAFLSFVPLPGMHRCLGFSGFFGFFGLIGFAVMIEMAAQRKARKASGQHAGTGTPFGPGRQLLLVLGGALLTLVAAFIVFFRIATPPSPEVLSRDEARRSSGIVRYLVFDAPANLTDRLVPPESRQSAEQNLPDATPKTAYTGSPFTASPQTAELSAATLQELLSSSQMTFVEKTREAADGQRLADGWSYSHTGRMFGGGTGTGFLKVARQHGADQFRVEYLVFHNVDAGRHLPIPLQALILWHGVWPSANSTRTFLIPFVNGAGEGRYLVVAFHDAQLTAALQRPGAPNEQPEGPSVTGPSPQRPATQPRGSILPSIFAPASIPGFGPLQERTLEVGVVQGDLRLKNCWINFESGEVFSYPEGMEQAPFAEAEAKLYEQGVAATCIESQGGPVLKDAGERCRFMPLSPSDEAKLTAAALPAIWRQGVSSETTDYGSWDQLPRSFLFRLRNGRMGVLQIAALAESPRGVKIRYRLVEAPSTRPESQAKVQLAEQRLRRIEQLRAIDAASPLEVEEAQLKLELAKAEAGGDPALAAQAKLRASELRLRRLEELQAHDAASPAEVEAARLEHEAAKAGYESVTRTGHQADGQ